MLGTLTTLFAQRNQARSYRHSARMLETEARATRIKGGAQADRIEQTAARNQELASANLRRARDNQREAIGNARLAQGASGFTSEGTGNQNELDTLTATDRQIGNAAFNASVIMANAWQSASDTRTQARVNAEILESKAAQYRTAANGTQKAMWMTGLAGVAGAAVGVYNAASANQEAYDSVFGENGLQQQMGWDDPTAHAYLGSQLQSGFTAGLQGADVFSNLANSFNPYTAALTGEFNNRRNNWGSFRSIVSGTTPYNITGASNLLFS